MCCRYIFTGYVTGRGTLLDVLEVVLADVVVGDDVVVVLVVGEGEEEVVLVLEEVLDVVLDVVAELVVAVTAQPL